MTTKGVSAFFSMTSDFTQAEMILVNTIINNASVLRIKPERAAAILQSFAACIVVESKEQRQEEYTLPSGVTLN